LSSPPPAFGQGEVFAFFLVAIFGLIILRRAYSITQGVTVSAGRLLILPVIYVGLYGAELAALALSSGPANLELEVYASLTLDAALVAVGAVIAYGYTRRHVELYRNEGDPQWSYRLGALLPVVYVVLFVVRVVLETVILGEIPFAVPAPSALAGVPPLSLYILFVVDGLWGVSTGFLLGRNVGVYEEWRAREAGPLPHAA
jgi:hypothetical protein